MRFLLFLSFILLFVSGQRTHWTVPDRDLIPINNPNLGREINVPVDATPDRQMKGRMRNPNMGSFVDIPVVF